MTEEIVLQFGEATPTAVPRSIVGELRKLQREAHTHEYRLDESSVQEDQELLKTIDEDAFTAFVGALKSDFKWDFPITLLLQVVELAKIWDCPRVEKAGGLILSSLSKGYCALLQLLDCQRRMLKTSSPDVKDKLAGAVQEVAGELSEAMQHPEFEQVSPENFREIWKSQGRTAPKLEDLVRYLTTKKANSFVEPNEFLVESDIKKLSAADVRALSQANFKFDDDVLRQATPIRRVTPSGNNNDLSVHQRDLHSVLEKKVGLLNELGKWLDDNRRNYQDACKRLVEKEEFKLSGEEEEEEEEEGQEGE